MKKGICIKIKWLLSASFLFGAILVFGQSPRPANSKSFSRTVIRAQQPPGTNPQSSLTNNLPNTRTEQLPDSNGPQVPVGQQTVGLIDGPDLVCPGVLQEYCAPTAVGAKYNWSITGDGSITNTTEEPCVIVAASVVCDGSFTLRLEVAGVDFDTIYEQTILVQDKTSPKIICPKDITVSCDEQLPSEDVSAMVVFENCNGTVTRTFLGGVVYDKTCPNRYKMTRTYMATDACGNSTTCSQHLEVKDEVSPNLTCPGDITVSCGDTALSVNLFALLAVDNCGGWLAKEHVGDVKTFQFAEDSFQLIRTYKTTDLCGQTGTCTQKIDVFDNEAPAIACPPNLTVSCPGDVPLPDPPAVTASDNCDLPVVKTHAGDVLFNQICASRYQLTRTYQAEDLCGHTARCMQQITVNDQTPPSIACPANTTVSCADLVLPVDINVVTASDNCAVVVSHVKDEISGKICDQNFAVTRTFRAEDACGQSQTCTYVIQVQDQTASPVVCPPNVTVFCASEVPASNPDTAFVSDHCGNVLSQVTWLGDFITNKTCNNRYQIARSYRATDACGLSGVCVQIIQVDDQTPPALVCPANITVTCSGQIPVASPGDVSVQDDCAGGNLSLYFGETVTNGACPNQYLLTRTYRSKDACGNEGSCAQLISVEDQTPPTVKCPSNITVTCASLVPAQDASLVKPTDECTGPVTKSFGYEYVTDKTCANQFVLMRVYEATDACGNMGSCTQQITVSDKKPPAITCPPNMTVSSTLQAPPIDLITVLASGENCSGTITKRHVEDLKVNANCAENYQLVRIYQAFDNCGNTATCAQTITVKDQVPPSGKCPANITVGCAAEIPCSGSDPQMQALVKQLQTVYTDNSGSPVLVDIDSMLPVQECTTGNYTYGRTIRLAIHDACGNGTSCTVALSGSCFSTYTQDFWGTPASKIGSYSVTQVLDSLLEQGWLTIGNNIGCGWTASTAPCILKALPGNGPSVPFQPGNLPTCSSQMNNTLAGQLVALELNIRYNQRFRGLSLGNLPIAGPCLLDTTQFKALHLPANSTVKDLMNRTNDFLLSTCNDSTYALNYGDTLSMALAAVNGYWSNSQQNQPCKQGNFNSGDDRGAAGQDVLSSTDGLTLWPNPVSGVLLVSFRDVVSGKSPLRVFDAEGRLIYSNTVTTQNGVNTAEIDVSTWKPGLYWLSLTTDNIAVTKRFVVLR